MPMRIASIMLLAVCATGTRQSIKVHQQQAVSEVAAKMDQEGAEMDEKTGHRCCVCDLSWGKCKKGSYGYAKRSSHTQECRKSCGGFQRCWDADPEKDCSAMGM